MQAPRSGDNATNAKLLSIGRNQPKFFFTSDIFRVKKIVLDYDQKNVILH